MATKPRCLPPWSPGLSLCLCLVFGKDPDSRQRSRTGKGAPWEEPRASPGRVRLRRVQRFPGDGGGRRGAVTPGRTVAARRCGPDSPAARGCALGTPSAACAPRTGIERGLRALIRARALRTGVIGEIRRSSPRLPGGAGAWGRHMPRSGGTRAGGALHARPSRNCGAHRRQGPAARRANLRDFLKNTDDSPLGHGTAVT